MTEQTGGPDIEEIAEATQFGFVIELIEDRIEISKRFGTNDVEASEGKP